MTIFAFQAWFHRCVLALGTLSLLSAYAQDSPPTPQLTQEQPGRHALVVTVGKYQRADLVPLPGTKVDQQSARQIAKAMNIPLANIALLADEQATSIGIRKAISQLNERTQPGDRVYLHFSGHGTRSWDPALNDCVEGFLAYDNNPNANLTSTRLAEMLAPISAKTDKLFVVYDACHSGGLTPDRQQLTRGWTPASGGGILRARFAETDQRCSKPTNIRTRNLAVEQESRGVLPQDLVYLAAARPDEISFDDEQKGGLATQYLRDCIVGGAKDIDGSGTIDISEIRKCAQEKIDLRLEGDVNFKAPHLVLQGNPGFVPVWFSQPTPTTLVKPFSAQSALKELYAQRNAKHDPTVTLASSKLRVGQDTLSLTIRSEYSGWIYVFAAGSDGKTLNMLFPNPRDQAHRMEAGATMKVPRSHWTLTAQGPTGTNSVAVFLTQTPIDLTGFATYKSNTNFFVSTDPSARVQLARALLNDVHKSCVSANSSCSRGFGAAIFDVVEE